MICSNCNKEIEDGSTYCVECGAPIDEPVVIKDIKTKASTSKKSQGKLKDVIQYDGPFIDFSGYVKSLGNNTAALIGLLGAILVYLAPFFSWLWQHFWDNKISANLFALGGKNDPMSLREGVLIVMAVLIILSALDMLAFSGCRYIGPLKAFEKNYIVRALPIVLTIIFLVIIMKNDAYQMAMDSIESQIQSAQNFGAGSNVDGGIGVGPVMLIAGQILYGVSICLDAFKRK